MHRCWLGPIRGPAQARGSNTCSNMWRAWLVAWAQARQHATILASAAGWTTRSRRCRARRRGRARPCAETRSPSPTTPTGGSAPTAGSPPPRAPDASGALGVLVELPAGPALAQQVPALVKGLFEAAQFGLLLLGGESPRSGPGRAASAPGRPGCGPGQGCRAHSSCSLRRRLLFSRLLSQPNTYCHAHLPPAAAVAVSPESRLARYTGSTDTTTRNAATTLTTGAWFGRNRLL